MEFVCRVGTPEGRVIELVEEAPSDRVLREDLERRGYHVFDSRPRSWLSMLRQASLGRRGKRVPVRDLLIFNQELAALLRSGLPVLQALDLMLERQRDREFRELLGRIRDRVKSGEDLSQAVSGFADRFPALYSPTLRAGERSGELEQVLRRFVRYQRLLLEARRRVVSALVYPAALVGLSICLIAVMMVYVLPRFTDFFTALNTELPLITRATMGLARFTQDNALLLAVILTAAVVLAIRVSRTSAGQLLVSRLRLRVPLLGAIFHRMALSEFCRSLATLLSGGIPAISALETSAQAVGNAHLRRKLEPTVGRVREGVSLAAALEETGVASAIVVDMVKVGETTGSLDEMLSDVADFLDEEVETRLERVLSLLEPVMMMLMGIIVATLLISVYLPIFSLLGKVQA